MVSICHMDLSGMSRKAILSIVAIVVIIIAGVRAYGLITVYNHDTLNCRQRRCLNEWSKCGLHNILSNLAAREYNWLDQLLGIIKTTKCFIEILMPRYGRLLRFQFRQGLRLRQLKRLVSLAKCVC